MLIKRVAISPVPRVSPEARLHPGLFSADPSGRKRRPTAIHHGGRFSDSSRRTRQHPPPFVGHRPRSHAPRGNAVFDAPRPGLNGTGAAPEIRSASSPACWPTPQSGERPVPTRSVGTRGDAVASSEKCPFFCRRDKRIISKRVATSQITGSGRRPCPWVR